MILICWASAIVFPVLTLLGGTLQSIDQFWQPAIIGCLFLAGQIFTLVAVARGDVSVVAPVLGIKVLMVPAIASLFFGEQLSPRVWLASAVAVVGIGFVQTRDAAVQRSHITAAITFALLAALAMTLFDLLIQRWAPAWGAGCFLPIAFAAAAIGSMAFLPWADRPTRLQHLGVIGLLSAGAALMAVQAIGMTLTLGLFGDATRVNIVYSLRGLWGVLLTWALVRASLSDGGPSHRTMAMRLIGAVFIGLSVILAVT